MFNIRRGQPIRDTRVCSVLQCIMYNSVKNSWTSNVRTAEYGRSKQSYNCRHFGMISWNQGLELSGPAFPSSPYPRAQVAAPNASHLPTNPNARKPVMQASGHFALRGPMFQLTFTRPCYQIFCYASARRRRRWCQGRSVAAPKPTVRRLFLGRLPVSTGPLPAETRRGQQPHVR